MDGDKARVRQAPFVMAGIIKIGIPIAKEVSSSDLKIVCSFFLKFMIPV